MSKSFTASAILLLRDAGAPALDDPAAEHVPELAGGMRIGRAAPVTIRQLLTMMAWFPTDDPWGDRQQGLPITAFDALLAAASRPTGRRGPGSSTPTWLRDPWPGPGRGVRRRLRRVHQDPAARAAAPAGPGSTLTSPSWRPWPSATGTGPAAGRRCRSTRTARSPRWAACPRPSPTSPAGWPGPRPRSRPTAAATPPRRGDGTDAQPLRPAIAAADAAAAGGDRLAGGRAAAGGPPAPPEHHGFGLFVDEDPSLGRVVSHSGGYPGFGSNMRWHPATGIGVIALGNGTYAPMSPLTGLVLDALVRPRRVPAGARARRDLGRPGGAPGRRPSPPRNRSTTSWRPGTTPPPTRCSPRTSPSTAPTTSAATPSASSASASAISAPTPRARPSPTPRPTAAGG